MSRMRRFQGHQRLRCMTPVITMRLPICILLIIVWVQQAHVCRNVKFYSDEVTRLGVEFVFDVMIHVPYSTANHSQRQAYRSLRPAEALAISRTPGDAAHVVATLF